MFQHPRFDKPSTRQPTAPTVRRTARRLLTAALSAAVLAGLCPPASSQGSDAFFDKLLTLGTGTQGGAFWPIGESLCELINQPRASQRVRCIATPTAGSVYNINAVAHGRLQLGIAQEDLVLKHVGGGAGQGFDALRQVAVLHQSPVTVLARASANITRLDQIKGARINMGNRGSGQFTVTTAIIQALQLTTADFAEVLYEPTSAFERLFCGGKVDVVVEIVPHPVEVFDKLLACGGRLLDIPPEVGQRLMAENPSFRKMAIPANSYAGQGQAVQSVGVRNLLISHTRVSDESIARVARLLAQGADALRQRQPLLATMAPTTLLAPGPAPAPAPGGAAVALHAGVLRANPR